jgi:hypothetical protein
MILLTQAFDTADADKSGSIDRDELRMMLPPTISLEQVGRLFTQLAADGSGEIRMEQMIRTLQAIEHGRSEARARDGRSGGAGDEGVRSSAAFGDSKFDDTGESFQNTSGLVSEVSRYGGTGDSFESESFLGGDESLALSESNM